MQKIILVHLLLLSFAILNHSLPLSTSKRWIVDDATGARLKLTCVNWAAHLEPMLAEGLDKRPLSDIARHVATMGFNCVRLTWATYMFTRYATTTVAQSFYRLGLQDALEGIARNNPEFLEFTLVEAQRAVIEQLGRNGVMVVLDNQVSEPKWCCGDHDGNGFFGDEYFDPKEWLQGLDIVAQHYKYTPMVVGMSLRNELRGRNQNETFWFRYMQRGARTVHHANPNLLVIISGLNYDLDFTFLKKDFLRINFRNKLVYEIHRYAFSSGEARLWLQQPFDQVCQSLTHDIQTKAGFLVEGVHPAPLFVSEFGVYLDGPNRAENLFLDCFLGLLAQMDLDWSIWALQGSYYIRNGIHGFDETFGMLNTNWTGLRNPEFHEKLQLIRQKIQDPKSKEPEYSILYQPSSGLCIQAQKSDVVATNCRSFSRWTHIYQNKNNSHYSIQLTGTNLCLTVIGDGYPLHLSTDCTSSRSQWEALTNSKFQVANRDAHGTYLCLDWGNNGNYNINNSPRLLTKVCRENLGSQRFNFILANV